MTTLVYNDVILRDCNTVSMQQDIEYDESRTDPLYSRFRIAVESTVVAIRYPSQGRQFGIQPPVGQTAAQRMHDIQARLSEARKDFWFLVDSCPTSETSTNPGVVDQPLLIACGQAFTEVMEDVEEEGEVVGQCKVRTPLTMYPHPFSSNSDTYRYGPGSTEFPKENVLDCNNGPKPMKVDVKQIIGGRSLRVEFEIEVCLRICKQDYIDEKPAVFGDLEESNKPEIFDQPGQDNCVLSNRWSLDETIDESWVTTKVMQGTLRVANKSVWAHGMRYLCVPPLLDGYRRMKQNYSTDLSGLALQYRIEDKQQHAAPPPPATDFSGHHTEACAGPNGTIKTGEVFLRLTGPPGVDKHLLIGAAGKVIANRIKGILPTAVVDDGANESEHSVVLNNASVVDVLHQPTVEMRVQVQYSDPDAYKTFALRIQEMGTSLSSIGDPEPVPQEGEEEKNTDLIDNYSAEVFPVPLNYDSESPAGVFDCYLQHPCSIWHDIPGGYTPGSKGQAYSSRSSSEESERTPSPTATNRNMTLTIPDDGDRYRPASSGGDLPRDQIYRYPYTFISLEQRYDLDNGWVRLPLATTAPGARSAALIKMHNRTARRILKMTATRNGYPPMLPSFQEEITDANGNREVLGRIAVINTEPKIGPNGRQKQFTVQTEHHYLLEQAPSNAGVLRGIGSPLHSTDPADSLQPSATHLTISQVSDLAQVIQADGTP